MRILLTLFWLASLVAFANAQQPDEKLRELERKLDQAASHIQQLTSIVESLRTEIANLKSEKKAPISTLKSSSKPEEKPAEEFIERIIEPELGASERNQVIEAKPEIF